MIQHVIVIFTRLVILQYLVCIREFLKFLHVASLLIIWMKLSRELPIVLRDLRLGGVSRHIEHIVAVLLAAIESSH